MPELPGTGSKPATPRPVGSPRPLCVQLLSRFFHVPLPARHPGFASGGFQSLLQCVWLRGEVSQVAEGLGLPSLHFWVPPRGLAQMRCSRKRK